MTEPTRPAANVKAEPVRWLYELPNGEESIIKYRNSWAYPDYEGWTETPLYPASALEQVRKDALANAIVEAEKAAVEAEKADMGGRATGLRICAKLRALQFKD